MGSALDVMIAYKFVKILATPWKKTDAYKLGIIDDNGDVLIKRKDLKTGTQKKAYTLIHRLVWNIKKLLDKLPPTRTKLGSFAAALWLLKEEWGLDKNNTLLEDSFLDYINIPPNDSLLLSESQKNKIIKTGDYMVRKGVFYNNIKEQDIITINKIEPIGHILGVQLVEGIHKNTGKKVLISNEDIFKIY
jgi:hypothetical protein|tara:strand:- start:338 stop:907 length:570 start_codon:yes stop_codon:yes gene_type:complete